MTTEQIAKEIFDLVWSWKLTDEDIRDHIKRTYEISSDRLADEIIQICRKQIDNFKNHTSFIYNN